ncbi:hypothetical protein HYR99_41815 [Candidatus Poribacteria bacterium]|nr:hypothetical protein [Candidatus Poribacteria bacterium]
MVLLVFVSNLLTRKVRNAFRKISYRSGKNFNPSEPNEFLRHVDDLKISPNSNKVHIDLWGEGWYKGAINLNSSLTTTTTGIPGRPIPNLINIDNSFTLTRLPLKDKVADFITLESGPINSTIADEISRIIRTGGKIRLGHPGDVVPSLHHLVIRRVNGSFTQEIRAINGEHFTITRIIVTGE